MSELMVKATVYLAGVYFLAGIAFALYPRQRTSGASESDTLARRLVLIPGMMMLWPLAWRRHHDASPPRVGNHPGPSIPSSRWLHRLQGALVLSLAVLAPLAMAFPVISVFSPARNHHAPLSILREQPWIQKGGSYGNILSSIPGKVYLGRDAFRRQGLLIRFNKGASYTPTALYWSGNPDGDNGFPADATYLGMVSGPEDCWIEIETKEMRNSGQWIVYSPYFRTFDSYTFSSDRDTH